MTQFLRLGHQQADEFVVDLVVHVEPLGRGADLPAVEVGGEGRPARRDVERGRGHDDEGVVARCLDQAGLEGFGAGAGNGLTDGDRSGIGHAMRLAAGHQPLGHARTAGEALHQTFRQALEHLHEFQRGDAGLFVRLDDDGVACGQCGCGLPAQKHERIVERQDDDDGAQRLLDGKVELPRHGGAGDAAGFVAGDLGVIVHRGRAPRDLVERFLERLALLARQVFGVKRLVAAHDGGDLVHHHGAAAHVDRVPGAACGQGHFHCGVNLGIGRVGDLADPFFGGGFDHVEMLGRLAGLVGAADEKLA